MNRNIFLAEPHAQGTKQARSIKIRRLLRHLTHRLIAPCCLNCRNPLKPQAQVKPQTQPHAIEQKPVLCEFCEQLHNNSLLSQHVNCLCCSLPLAIKLDTGEKGKHNGTILCAECQKDPFMFTRCIAATVFEGVPAQLVKHLKHGLKTSAAAYMANNICVEIQRRIPDCNSQPPVDCLIPVPIHKLRLRQRGFNQAELIAASISRTLNIQLETNACNRKPTGYAQQLLNRRERKKNLKNAFSVSSHILAGRRIAIIDDVVTTGETASQLAKVILNAGALHCEVWSYARTGKPNNNKP